MKNINYFSFMVFFWIIVTSANYNRNNEHFMLDHCEGPATIINVANEVSSSGVVKLSRHYGYPGGLNCSLTFLLEHELHVAFNLVDIYKTSDGCYGDYLLIYDDQKLERICGNTHPAEFVTNKPALYLNFVSARHNDSLDINKQGFELHYSSVRKVAGSCDPEKEFTCHNKSCINIELVCDGKNNCGDGSDETLSVCFSTYIRKPWVIVIIVAVSMLILCVCCCCCCKINSSRGGRNILNIVCCPCRRR